MDWSALPLRRVLVARLVWPCHDLDPAHIHPTPELNVSQLPIHVEVLVDGSLFIHDGRHRAARARLRGARMIEAYVLTHSSTEQGQADHHRTAAGGTPRWTK